MFGLSRTPEQKNSTKINPTAQIAPSRGAISFGSVFFDAYPRKSTRRVGAGTPRLYLIYDDGKKKRDARWAPRFDSAIAEIT